MAQAWKWARAWLRISLIYLSITCVVGSLFGWWHQDHRPWLLVVKAFSFGGFLMGLQGVFSKPPAKDTDTEAGEGAA